MDLTHDFSRVVLELKKLLVPRLKPECRSPRDHGSPRVVAVAFDGTLAEFGDQVSGCPVGNPFTHAVWALTTFKHNGWEVEIFTERDDVEPVWGWVEEHAAGLVDRVNEGRGGLQYGECGVGRSVKPDVDVFVDSKSDYWVGRRVDWIEVMVRLNQRGLLEKGLLPFSEAVEVERTMIESLEEPLFKEIISDIKAELDERGETRENLIEEVEKFVRTHKNLGDQADMLRRAKMAGRLLECVLKLMVRDRFDPVGCILLAQQDREHDFEFDSVPPMSEGLAE